MRSKDVWFYCFLFSAIAIAILIYMLFSKKKSSPTRENVNLESPSTQVDVAKPPPAGSQASGHSGGGNGELVLFWGSWCGHSTAMMPEWEKVEQMGIKTQKFESADAEAMTANGVQGFPTIKYFPKGYQPGAQAIDYHGPRVAEAMVAFASSQ